MNRVKKFTIAQGVIILLLVIFVIALLLGNHAKKIDFSKFVSAFGQEETVGKIKERTKNDVRKTFGIDLDSMENVLYFSGEGIMDVSELLVVEAKTTDDAQRIQEAVEAYIEVQKNNFDGYGTNQFDLLSHGIILRKGVYCFLAVSENADQWEEVFRSCF